MMSAEVTLVAPVIERRNPASLALAVLVHVAIGGIVWGLCRAGAPPPADPVADEPVPVVEFHRRPARQRGGGPVKPQGPKVVTPPPVVQPPPVVTPPPIEPPDASPEPSDDAPVSQDGPSASASSDQGGTGRGPGGPDGEENGVPDGWADGQGPATAGDAGGPSSMEPVILRADMVAPRILHRPDPDYPLMCRRSGAKGEVILRCIIDTRGRVRVEEVLKSIDCLDEPAIEAVERWRYEPAIYNGRPQAVFQTVRVMFR